MKSYRSTKLYLRQFGRGRGIHQVMGGRFWDENTVSDFWSGDKSSEWNCNNNMFLFAKWFVRSKLYCTRYIKDSK